MDKLIAFGDSVMKGVVYDGNTHHVLNQNFISLWSDAHNTALANHAKMGNTISDVKLMFSKRKEYLRKGDTVLLECGGNDCDFDWDEIAKNPEIQHLPHTEMSVFVREYKSLLAELQKMGTKIVLFSLPPLDSQYYFDYLSRKMTSVMRNNVLEWLNGDVNFISKWHEQYNIAVFKIAKEMNVPIIDITSCFLSTSSARSYICKDGIHPNEKGHLLIFNAILSQLQSNMQT